MVDEVTVFGIAGGWCNLELKIGPVGWDRGGTGGSLGEHLSINRLAKNIKPAVKQCLLTPWVKTNSFGYCSTSLCFERF